MPTQVQNANATHTFGAGTGATAVTLSATSPGNLIAVAFTYTAYSGSFTISDSSGSNTWVIASPTNASSQDPPAAYDSANEFGALVAWTFSTASVTSVTLTTGNKYYGADATASEWSGLGAYQGSSSANNDTGTNPASPPALTLATASDVVIGAGFPQFGTWTPDSPLTAFSSDTTGYTAYAQPGASGSYTPAWANPNTRDWAAATAVFTTSPGPGGAPFYPATQAIRCRLPQHPGQSQQIYQPGLIYVRS
jgi:hypothetical protein